MVHAHRPSSHRRRGAVPRLTPLARGLLAACLLSPALTSLPVQAAGPAPVLPTGPQVVHGQATVATQGGQMTVRNTSGAILNWQSFSIAAGHGVHFDQASASSKVLNRVVGNDPSRIFGSLTSNGQVWLLNPNGVLFGQGARVDVASLVASTLRLGDSDFLAGRYRFGGSDGNGLAAGVRNEGSLQTSFGGQVVLLGGRVENTGDIQAPGGQVALAAARSVDLVDTGLPNLAVRMDLPAGEVLNLGRLAAAGGRVDVYGAIVNQQGLVSAQTLSLGAQGQIVLRASQALTLGEASRTEALATEAGRQGGDITLAGRDIVVAGAAVVDASGQAGGGRIRLGGDLQGRDTGLPNAATVQVDAAARLRADAGQLGQGGQVIVWSDQSTRFLGRLSAQGGALGGDGGFAEVSSKGLLDFAGTADLRAATGRTGTLLLDPANLTIASSGASLSGTGGDLNTSTVSFSDYPGVSSVITASALNTQLNSSNVVLQATNNITVDAAVSGSRALTLQAGNNIAVNAAISASNGITLSANDPGGSGSGSGTVSLASGVALSASSGTLTISNNGGSGTHSLGGNLTASTLSITGAVQLSAASTWTLSGSSTLTGLIGGSSVLTKAGSGTLNLTASGSYAPIILGAGTLNFNHSGTATLAALTLTGGTLGGSGDVVVSGAFNASGSYAYLNGSGSFTTQGSSSINLAGVTGGYLGVSRPWVNEGTLSIGGDDYLYLGYNNGATLTNAASGSIHLDTSSTQGIYNGTGTNTVNNAGSLQQGSSGTRSIATVFNNTGTVQIGAGTLTIAASGTDTGSYAVDSGATLAFSSGTRTLNDGIGFSGAGSLLVSGATLNFNSSSPTTLPRLRMTSGTLGGSGDVVIGGNFDVSGSYAYLTGSGTLTTQGTSTVNLAGVNGGFLGLNRNWVNNGTLNIAGDDYLYLGYSGGGNTTLSNASGATLNIESSHSTPLAHYTGSTSVNNAGTLNLNVAGTHAINTGFSSTGTVNVNAGTLALGGNGTDSGSFQLATGTTLAVTAGTRTLAATADVSGPGTVRVDGGTLNIIDAAGTADTPVLITGGTLNFNGGAVTLPSLTLQGGTLTGSGDVTVSGAFDVTGGYAYLAGSGTLTTLGTSTVNLANLNGGYLGLNRNWINQGTLNLAGDDYIYMGVPNGGSTTLSNAVNATINIGSSHSNALVHYTGTTTVDNAGTLNLNVSGSHSLTPTSFNNSGTVNVNAGTLALGGSGTDSGTYTVASGAVLNFSGTRTLDIGTNITGAGTLQVSGGTTTTSGTLDLANTGAAIVVSNGTLNLGGSASGNFAPVSVSGGTLNFNNSATVTLPSLTLSGGTVGGSGDVVISGAFDVTGGYAYLTGSGLLTTQGTSTVNLANVNGGYLGLNRNWTNQGTLNLAGDDYIYLGLPNGGSTTLSNAANATINIGSSHSNALAHYTGTTTVQNAGTLNVNTSGSHTLSASNFHNSGAVNLQAGNLVLSANGSDSGSYAVASGATLDLAGGTRTLEASSSVSGAGTLRVSGATVHGNGSLGLVNTGAAIAVSSGTLNLGGAVSGTLAPTSVSGGTLNFNNSSAVTLPSLTLTAGTVGGSGDVIVSGAFDVTGSYAYLTGSGLLTTQGTSTLNLANLNGGYLGLSRNWTNQGTLNIAGDDYVYLGLPNGGTSTLSNAAQATLNLSTTHSQPLAYYTGTANIVNAGTLNQTASGAHLLSASSFHNSGAVNVQAGSLGVSANGSDSGSYAVASGATLDFAGGTRTLDTASSVSGAGVLKLSGATVQGLGALTLANTGSAIVVQSGTLNLGGSVSGTLAPTSVSGGTLNFNNSSAVTLPSLTLSGGSIGGSGDVIVSGAFDVTGGYAYLSGSGALTTQGTSTVNLSSVNGGYLGLSRNWINQGTLNIAGDDYVYLGLPNGGTHTLSNASGATLNISSTNTNALVHYTGTTTVDNAGTLNLSASGSHTLSASNFHNSGTVQVQAGTLVISASGSDSGSYALAAGGMLNLSAGARSLVNGAGFSGPGGLLISGGTLNVEAAVNMAGTPVQVSGGTLNFNNPGLVTLPSLSLAGGTLGGSGDVAVRGAFDLTGSYASLTGSGSLNTQGTSTVNLASVNGGYVGVSRNWNNSGTLTIGGDDFLYFGLPSGGSSTLTNLAGATLTLSSTHATPLSLYTGTQNIVNAGTLNQTAAGSHAIGLPFSNSGTVQVQAGMLSLSGNGSDTGSYALSAGTALSVAGGTRTLASGAMLTGSGLLSVSGGVLNVDAAIDFSSTPVNIAGGTLNFNHASAVSLPSLNLSSGTLGGSGDVVVAGAFDVTASHAFLTGSGSLTTEGTSTVNLASVGSGYLGVNRRWNNRGHLTVGGDDFLYFGLPSGGGTVNNSTLSNLAGATLTLASSHASPLLTYSGASALANAGTLELAAAGAHNLSLGSVQNTGSLQLSQGAWTVTGTLEQSGLIQTDAGTSLRVFGNLTNQASGTLAGTGSLIVGGTLTNLGTLRPAGDGSAGTLSISGNLVLSGGTLAVDLGGGSASDLLAVSGNVTLGGNLSASLLPGYTPQLADHLAIVSAGGTSSGAFSGTSLPAGWTAGYQLAANEASRLIYAGSGTKVFTNAANDLDWNTPANWNGALPGSGDSVILSAGYDVLHASGSHSIAALTIAGGNSLQVSGGALTVSGATTLAGSLTVSGSGVATLQGDLSGGGQLAVQGGSLLLHGAASLARLSLSGGLLGGSGSLQVSESFSRSPAASIAGDFSSIAITQLSGPLQPGALSAGTVSLLAQDPTATLTLDGRVASAGALSIQAAGPVQLAGSAAALSAGGELSLHAHSLDLAAPISGQRLVVVGTHGVQLRDAAQLSASASSGDAIVLDAAGTGPFVNHVGATALATGGGRWLVYSADPSADTVGGLAAEFRQYNAPYGASTPLGSGNGLLYSLAPTLSIGLQGTVSKVYDGTAQASLLPSNYSLAGALAIDRVTLSTPASGVYTDGGSPSKNAGSGKTVQVSGLSLSVSDSTAGYPVYGLQFNTTASAAVGSITPAPLAVSGLAAQSKVYDAGTSAGLGGVATVSPLAGDSLQLAGTASAQFADKHVGTAKPVTVSGLSLAGADAGNYSLLLPTGLTADITPAPLVLSGLAVLGKVYDGSTAASLGGVAMMSPLAGDSLQLAGTASARFADKQVGTAKPVTVSGLSLAGADAGNYSLQLPAGLTADITPAPLVLSGLSVLSKVYDGSTAANLGGTPTISALAGDQVQLSGTASARFADKNVGTAKPVELSGLALGGSDAGNYMLQLPTGLQADITPRPLAVLGLAVADKVYDGSTTASASASLGGAVAGDALGLALTAQFADRHAGSAKNVGVQLQLTGADAGNYQLPSASATAQASIVQATLTYLATPLSAPVGGVLPPLSGTVSGWVGGDSLADSTTGTLTWTTPATAASPAGRYAVSGGGLSAANYRFVQADGNATALTLNAPILTEVAAVASSSNSATQTAITQALAVVSPPVEMSTPTSGRVLDVMQSLSAGDAAGNTPTYDSVNLSQMQRDEIQSLLAARANFKRKVFDGGIGKLQIDPALADVRGCRNVVELSGGACLLTAALKQEIEAERARAAALAAATEAASRKPPGRRVVRAVLPTIQRKLALLIGVNAYNDKRIPQLKGAVPDARGVRDVLENHLGYETTVVEDPGREAIVRALNKLALEAGPEDSVVIYYAGHGVVVPVDPDGKEVKDGKVGNKAGTQEQGYWVPGDGDVDKPETWLSNSDIAKLVALVGARQVLLVSDSCYSGTLAGSERVQLEARGDAADLLKRKAAVVMSSGGNEPVADVGRNGHSVFAWYLMETLKKLSDWTVGVSVFDSVRTAVARSLPQTPQYGASRSAGHQGNTDYLFEQREIERPTVQ